MSIYEDAYNEAWGKRDDEHSIRVPPVAEPNAGLLAAQAGTHGDVVLGQCVHGVDLDRAFCPQGCRV